MNLKPAIVETLNRMGFTTATEVQEQVIPLAIQGKDLIVRAKTGTGKTFAFLVPIMERKIQGNKPEVLIMAPTRELALQIYGVASKLRSNSRDSVAVVYGGASINNQMQALGRSPDLVIGTPGRILDLFNRGALKLDAIRFLVLDEADTMFDMGFIDSIEMILSKTPRTRQTLLFSATIPRRIIAIAAKHMKDPQHISVGSEEEPVVAQIKHFYAESDREMKFATLLAYINKYNPRKAIIFVQTQRAASMVYETLVEQHIDAILMHGGLTQARREHSLREFSERSRFLVATNVAARGIDIAGISDIINFDAPDDPNIYVHRVGRTARMDADGRAFTIVAHDERHLIGVISHENNLYMDELRLDIAPYASIRVFKHRRSFNRESEGGQSGQQWHKKEHGFRGPSGSSSSRGSFGRNRGGYRGGGGQRGRRRFG
jgi:ATP-dependent RNA helicase DeaD